tara:strand:- start:633 stop:2069 length:1437 start_codon:yes stop_codon:yes gene_type:complete
MTIKRYFAEADNTITNAFQDNLTLRGTGSNMGAADILEVFSIFGQATTSSSELSRVLLQFNVDDIATDRTNGNIPASGKVSFFLKMYNAEHVRTTPRDFRLTVSAVSQSWQEGSGLDMENYTDKTFSITGSNWVKRSGSAAWESAGGDYHASPTFEAKFQNGREDMELNVTSLVEEWIAGTKSNYGFGVKLTDASEAMQKSFYTKKFFSRTSEFFYKRPVLEARFNDAIKDDRGYFFASSSLAPPSDNINTIYLYNVIRGRLRNIPAVGDGAVYVDLYDATGSSHEARTLCINTPATGGIHSTGIYSASVCINTTASTLHDVWHNGAGTQYHTGTIKVKRFEAEDYNPNTRYVMSISNLKEYYQTSEIARFRLYVRPKNWSPTIHTVASNVPETTIIPSGAFEIKRVTDGLKVIPFGTGSDLHTGMSYDVSGNYFDLDLSMLEGGYSYNIKFAFYDDVRSSWECQPYEFKFKVREDEY